MRCPGCQEEIPDDVEVCPNCGRRKGPILKARNWECPDCGKINGPERSSCWNCG